MRKTVSAKFGLVTAAVVTASTIAISASVPAGATTACGESGYVAGLNVVQDGIRVQMYDKKGSKHCLKITRTSAKGKITASIYDINGNHRVTKSTTGSSTYVERTGVSCGYTYSNGKYNKFSFGVPPKSCPDLD